MTMTDERKEWLRGAYLDRITEAAQHFARGRVRFVNVEWLKDGDDFRYLSELSAEDQDYLRDLAAFDALRRIRDSSEYPPETAELLRGMDPVRLRPTEHVTDPLRSTPLGMRIDDDTGSFQGRQQELLIEFGWHLQDAVNGACVKEEYLDGYVRDEVSGWREFAVQPLTESDEEFLREYLHGLILEEYERVRIKQQAEHNNNE